MKKYMLGFGIVAMAAGAMAFPGEKAPEEKSMVMQYQFNGSSLEDVHDLDQWSAVTGGAPSCGGSAVPCVVTVQSGSLEDWLNDRTAEQIRTDATSRKN